LQDRKKHLKKKIKVHFESETVT